MIFGRSDRRYCSSTCRSAGRYRRLKERPEPPSSPHDDHFDDEPPGPGSWEWSDAYGWVEVEPPAVNYDVRTGIVVTEAGETREAVRDGWHGPAN